MDLLRIIAIIFIGFLHSMGIVNQQSLGEDSVLVLYIVSEVGCVFLVTLIVDKLRIFLFGKMDDWVISKVVSIGNKFWQHIVLK